MENVSHNTSWAANEYAEEVDGELDETGQADAELTQFEQGESRNTATPHAQSVQAHGQEDEVSPMGVHFIEAPGPGGIHGSEVDSHDAAIDIQ